MKTKDDGTGGTDRTRTDRPTRAASVREHVWRYLRRRTPWDAPWILYVIAIGAANIARQVLLPDDVSTAAQIATFAAMVVGVGLLVTLVHRLLTTRREQPDHATETGGDLTGDRRHCGAS